MALMRFFKTPQNQKFDYKPRYWDPKKEELQERLSKYKDETKGDTKAVKNRLRKGFKGKAGSAGVGFRETRAIRTKELKRSNRVLLITVVVLALLSYLLFEIYLTEIVDMLE
ncbi:MAG: hypothetical protein AB8G86_10505 [Saprospiraceae bacterium]